MSACDVCTTVAVDVAGVSIADEDGACMAHMCQACRDKLKTGGGCAFCRCDTTGEYSVITAAGDWGREPFALCSECRKAAVFDNTPLLLNRLRELGITRFAAGGRE